MDIIDEKSVGILEEDKEREIVKIAKPMGNWCCSIYKPGSNTSYKSHSCRQRSKFNYCYPTPELNSQNKKFAIYESSY